MSKPVHKELDINGVKFDFNNPRIRRFIEQYGTDINAEIFYLALGQGGSSEEDKNAPSFESLKQSIKTNEGIITPIIVNKMENGEMIVIEGNTRLAIYREFHEDTRNKSDWSKIPSIVYDNLSDERIDAIRLQAHLVGPRPWDPYSKAKYLDHLRNVDHLPFSRLVDYCGGRQSEVERYINAFNDMEKYYRSSLPDDDAFDETRFSGFVEYQRPNIKKSVYDAGFSGEDFAKWIIERNIDPLNSVRQLPRILSDAEATKVFLEDNAREALRILDRPIGDISLDNSSIAEICLSLIQKINELDFSTFKKIKNGEKSDDKENIIMAYERLSEIVDELSEE